MTPGRKALDKRDQSETEAGPSLCHLPHIPFSFFCEPRPHLGCCPSCSQPISGSSQQGISGCLPCTGTRDTVKKTDMVPVLMNCKLSGKTSGEPSRHILDYKTAMCEALLVQDGKRRGFVREGPPPLRGQRKPPEKVK